VTTALVFYEGVMQGSRNRPIMEGFRLAQTLAMSNRLFIATSGRRDKVERELRTERIQDQIVDVLDETDALPPLLLWQRQIEVVLHRGPLSYLVAADPQIVEWAVQHGVLSLVFAHPRLNGPPRRPDAGNRSWERLLAELDVRP